MYYWKLTPHIVRYNHKSKMDNNAPHTVNERMLYLFYFLIGVAVIHIWADIRVESFVEMIRFFTTLILNVDEATTL